MTTSEKIRRHLASHPRRATQDSRRIHVTERLPTRDQKITADPAPRNPDIFGNSTAFTGRLAEMVAAVVATINTLPAKDRGAARSYAVVRIADAMGDHPSQKLGHGDDGEDPEQTDELTGGSMSRGPAGSYSTAGTRELGTAMTPAAVQRMNSNYWDRVGNRYRADARDSAAEISAPGSIRAISLANREFYANQPTAPGRRWGER